MNSKEEAKQKATQLLGVHLATEVFDFPYVMTLLRNGADIKIYAQGDTVLHKLTKEMLLDEFNQNSFAAYLADLKYLQERGGDVHAKNAEGFSIYELILNHRNFCPWIATLAIYLIQQYAFDYQLKNSRDATLLDLMMTEGAWQKYSEDLQAKILDLLLKKDLGSVVESRYTGENIELFIKFMLEKKGPEAFEKYYGIDPANRIDQKDFQKTQDLASGKGATGTVYSGLWNKQAVAIKETPLGTCEKRSLRLKLLLACREVAHFQRLTKTSVPSIVDFKGYKIAGDTVTILMEYARHGSLGLYCKNNPEPEWGAVSDWGPRHQWIENLAGGVLHMHNLGVLHCDFKPDNVVLVSDPSSKYGLQAKWIDFGFSLNKINANQAHGTPLFMPPEFLVFNPQANGNNNSKSDIYSFGMVIASLAQWSEYPQLEITGFSGPRIYYCSSLIQFQRAMGGGLLTLRIPTKTPDIIQTMIQKACARKPEDRPEASELKAMISGSHGFFGKTSLPDAHASTLSANTRTPQG